MTRTPTCRAHCSTCHRHFSSTKAFDAHRSGAHEIYRCSRCERDWPVGADRCPECSGPVTYTSTRHCVAPFEVSDMVAVIGDCRVYEHREGWGIARDIEIWGLEADAARIRAWKEAQAASGFAPDAEGAYGRVA